MPRELGEIDRHVRRKKNVHQIAQFAPRRRLDFQNVAAGFDQAFGQKKSGGEFVVVARRAHRDTDRAGIDPDFHGFFFGQLIVLEHGRGAGLPAQDVFRFAFQNECQED